MSSLRRCCTQRCEPHTIGASTPWSDVCCHRLALSWSILLSMPVDSVALTSDRSPADFIRHFVRKRLVEHPPYENPWTEESGWKSSSAESLQLDLPISWRGFSVCETRSNRPVGHPLFKRPSGDYWTVDGLLSLTLISSSWPHQAPKNTFSFLWSHSSEQHRLRAASFHYMAASR